MPATAAQVAANRRNAARSTGPRTPEGKERSRANSCRDGLTGEGVVLPPAEAEAVAERARLLEAELRPSTELGRILVRRVALLSRRMERSGDRELVATDRRVRSAMLDRDEARIAELDDLFGRIEAEPALVVRRLGRTAAGVDRLIGGWVALLDDLDGDAGPIWTPRHGRRAEALAGREVGALPTSDFARWQGAADRGTAPLSDAEAEDVGDRPVRPWALARIANRIALEIERLGRVRAELARDNPDLGPDADRAEAEALASFDPSREATLARRYEADAERGMYRALREFRAIEAAAEIARPDPEPAPAPGPAGGGRLASFFQGTDPAEPKVGPAFGRDRGATDAEGPAGRGRPDLTERSARPASTGSSAAR